MQATMGENEIPWRIEKSGNPDKKGTIRAPNIKPERASLF